MPQFTEHPPVPKVLQEALKDHPELIQELERGLRSVGRSPGMSKAQLTDQLEAAIGVLENILGLCASNAAEERANADASGDPDAMERARTKDILMFGCRSRVPDSLVELAAFFG
jgi:hypothetical protein